jgi:hypothetical protein
VGEPGDYVIERAFVARSGRGGLAYSRGGLAYTVVAAPDYWIYERWVDA